MSNYVNTTIETREAEVNYIVEIHKDMRDNCKHWYTNSYDFSNGDRVKITVEITKNWATLVTVAESEDNMGISKSGCSRSITKSDLDMAYKQGFADGVQDLKKIKKEAFIDGIEASKAIEWTRESEEIKRVLKEWNY